MKLGLVERWQAAVNARDQVACLATCAPNIEIVGPRGSAFGHAVLADWLVRAGFTAAVHRWFCGGAYDTGDVVIEHHARWSGADDDGRMIASGFVVERGQIARYERFDSLAAALAATGMSAGDEVTGRS